MNRTEGKWRNRNIFHYIVAVSTVLLLIFLSMGIYIYQYYYHTIYADFLAANERTLDYIMTRHESEMKILKNIVIQMLSLIHIYNSFVVWRTNFPYDIRVLIVFVYYRNG